MTTHKEALKLALEALKDNQHLIADNERHAYVMEYNSIIEKCEKALAQQSNEQVEPVTIWYMRDNHTFKKLSTDVSTALIEIEDEFNEGWTYGTLCSKRKGFPNVHANGEKQRLAFFAECKKTLEQYLGNTHPPVPMAQPKEPEQEPVALETVYETIIQWDEGGGKRSRRELARRIVSLYTIPPQRTWVGLTEQEAAECWSTSTVRTWQAIEAKLKEKNT